MIHYVLNRRQQTADSNFQQAADFLSLKVCNCCWFSADRLRIYKLSVEKEGYYAIFIPL